MSSKPKSSLYVRIYQNPDVHSVNPYRVDLMDGEEKLVLRTAPYYWWAWLMAHNMLATKKRELRKETKVRKFKERIIR